jgi:hypothetical protein
MRIPPQHSSLRAAAAKIEKAKPSQSKPSLESSLLRLHEAILFSVLAASASIVSAGARLREFEIDVSDV